MKLSDIMVFDAIVPELEATTRDESIAELVQALADNGAIPKTKVKEISEVVLQRGNRFRGARFQERLFGDPAAVESGQSGRTPAGDGNDL